MEMYYTDTSETGVNNNNGVIFDEFINEDDDDDEEELHFYEYGAHFSYKDLYDRLSYLVKLASPEMTSEHVLSSRNSVKVKKSRNVAQMVNHMNVVNRDGNVHNKNEFQFQFNNDYGKCDNCNYNNSNSSNSNNKQNYINKQQSKTSEHSSNIIKHNNKHNQNSLVISSLTVIDKMSKINNNINNNYHHHIKAKTNSNSNCSYQNINTNLNNNKPSSPPSTVKTQFVKKKISSIKYQNTNNTSNKTSNKSNPNLILYPSSSKSKSQLKAISELLKAKIKKGKNSIANSNNISSYIANKSRNVTKPTNKTVHCILNHNNIGCNSNSNNINNCIQYPQSKPHSVERNISNSSSRKITSYYIKPKVTATMNSNNNNNNTLFSPSLSSHTKGDINSNSNNNNTRQYSHNSINLSITSGIKRNNGYYSSSTNKHNTNTCYIGSSKSKYIKQKIISAQSKANKKSISNNSGNDNSNNGNNNIKCNTQQRQKVPSRNARNVSVIKNSINQTQNSHGCGNESNLTSKKGSYINCYSNTINSHSNSKKKLFGNSITIGQAINAIMKRKSDGNSNNVNSKGKNIKK